jgi:PhzF family phenazine biosynthesis protein
MLNLFKMVENLQIYYHSHAPLSLNSGLSQNGTHSFPQLMAQFSFEYTTVDVFADSRFTGNPLAIVRVPNEYGSYLTQERKQLIAREFNFSETVFLHEDPEISSQAKIDIFTTTEELPFAGHPTIGSACYLMSRANHAANADTAQGGTIITKSGQIPIMHYPTTGLTCAQIPHNVRIHQVRVALSDIVECQPDFATYQSQLPPTFPVVSIVKGMTFALIELPDIEMLARVGLGPTILRVDLDKDWAGSFVASYYFVKEERNGNCLALRTRMVHGFLEDPATGSAASTLAAFLSIDANTPNGEHKYQMVQGVEMGRRSEIGLKVRTNAVGDGVEEVTLSGKAVVVTEGKLWC